jgi:GrpB-like predicted nucleotidyltransferase (UPF0157 family)
LSESPADCLGALIAESEQHGLSFVRRLATEWTSGANRFDRPGEVVLIARAARQVVGVCGLNVDPYAARDDVGRVRHLYVLTAHRRFGVGRQLVTEIIEAARGRFDLLRLSTNNPAAAPLYEALGFRRADATDCTHVMNVGTRRQIVVVPWQPRWQDEFTRTAKHIRALVGPTAVRIDHIGSTAVRGLGAKDLIDLQITVADLDEAEALTTPLRAAGFRQGTTVEYDAFYGKPATDPELHKLFMREPESERRTNIHIRELGRFNQRYALLFRDYLRAADDVRAQYELLKRRAAQLFPESIDGYLSLKDPVVHIIYEAAALWAEKTGWGPDEDYV